MIVRKGKEGEEVIVFLKDGREKEEDEEEEMML